MPIFVVFWSKILQWILILHNLAAIRFFYIWNERIKIFVVVKWPITNYIDFKFCSAIYLSIYNFFWLEGIGSGGWLMTFSCCGCFSGIIITFRGLLHQNRSISLNKITSYLKKPQGIWKITLTATFSAKSIYKVIYIFSKYVEYGWICFRSKTPMYFVIINKS